MRHPLSRVQTLLSYSFPQDFVNTIPILQKEKLKIRKPKYDFRPRVVKPLISINDREKKVKRGMLLLKNSNGEAHAIISFSIYCITKAVISL